MVRVLWCSSCTKQRPVEQTDLGLICCTICGKIVDEDLYSNEPTFVKNASGQSQLGGNIVKTIQSDYSVSRERTLNNAYDVISHIADNLGVEGGDRIALPAQAFYKIALERNFTRGRRADQVAAACLYIACRENNKPFLLIEFSEFLRVNVYVLGAVFLQLCKLLHLEEHPIVQKPVDPSLFMHRFATGLLGKLNHEVEKTALRIVASMKRDWMQTGRKPSGICGAALYISALSHGFKFSKADIVKIVHICEATLTKRLIEFEDTESGSLTIEEFNQKAEELEKSVKSKHVDVSMSKDGELLCEHRGSGQPQFAHGLCKNCYDEFIRISGGLDGGSEPPAFQRAEKERLAKECADESAGDSLLEFPDGESCCENPKMEKEIRRLDVGGSDQSGKSGSDGAVGEHEAADGVNDKSGIADYVATKDDESETFSDIDDAEVDGYLHNEEEKQYKQIIWEEMNREYLEEQAAKEAAAAAAREALLMEYTEEEIAAQDLAAAETSKSRKERRQKRAAEAKNAQTAAEATHQMLSRKRISSKLNPDKLKELFDDPVISENPKKSRTEIPPKENKEEEPGTMDEEHEGNIYDGDYQDHSYYDNEGFDDGLF